MLWFERIVNATSGIELSDLVFTVEIIHRHSKISLELS